MHDSLDNAMRKSLSAQSKYRVFSRSNFSFCTFILHLKGRGYFLRKSDRWRKESSISPASNDKSTAVIDLRSCRILQTNVGLVGWVVGRTPSIAVELIIVIVTAREEGTCLFD